MATWGQYYHEIASQMALYRESNRRLCQLAELRPGMTVVDLGCGSGLTSLAALEQVPEGLRLILIDSSPSMVEEARRRLGDRAEAIHLADAAEGAALLTEKVDRVLCNMALWTFPNPEGVLTAWRERIKPAGRLCFNLFGTYFNTGGDVVSPQYALIQELHRRGELSRGLPAVDRLPNQRSIEGTLTGARYKPFHFELQEIEPAVPETEPGGELYNLMRLTPALPGSDHQEAVSRTLAALPELAEAIAAQKPRWRVVHFMAQPSVSPEEILLARFGGKGGH
ncbi:MAG: class I SAM-dependent methyltransferase [Bacillota bacterium]